MPDTQGRAGEDRDWFDWIGELRWQHVTLLVAAIAAFVALSIFTPGCSVSIKSSPTTTTTEAQ